ncbi:MAG: metallophosphoesterase [Planctomycetota bacterium]
MARRRIFVGDVQGCDDELGELLDLVRYDQGSDLLHPVGDLVNRGPRSLAALRRLRDAGALPVLGNHDVHLLRASVGLRALAEGDTIAEVLAAPDRTELLDWLAAQPFVRDLGDLYLVHAGIHPRWADPEAVLAGLDPLTRTPEIDFATRVRHCDAEGRRPEDDDDPPPGFEAWDHFYDPSRHDGRRVVFGHWASRGLVRTERAIGLDTGCVWGGRLTAWIAEEDRLVHVEARRVWRQPGRGGG